jgi:hypothetical protein
MENKPLLEDLLSSSFLHFLILYVLLCSCFSLGFTHVGHFHLRAEREKKLELMALWGSLLQFQLAEVLGVASATQSSLIQVLPVHTL